MTEPRVKCVIFDCEGTLVDSERLCCEALVQVFGEMGVTLSYQSSSRNFFPVEKSLTSSIQRVNWRRSPRILIC